MQGKNYPRLLFVLGVIVSLAITNVFVSQAIASPANTDIAQGGARLTQAASTAQAAQPNAQSTVQAVQTNAVSTAQAAQTNVNATVDVAQTAVNATVDSSATEIVATVDAVRTQTFATVEGLQTEIATTLEALGEDIDDALQILDFDYDADSGTVTITASVDENQLNTVLDTALTVAGYDDVVVSVDLVPNGFVITLEDVTLENGRVVTADLTYVLVETDGEYSVELTSIMINDIPVPADEFDDVLLVYLETYIQDIIDGVTTNFEGTIPAGATVVSVETDSVLITDDLIAVRVVITLES